MVKNKLSSVICSITFIFIFVSLGHSQDIGQWGVSVNGIFSQPVGGLSDWFKPSVNYGLSLGQQYNESWYLEGVLEYGLFEDENLSGYIDGKVDLSLEQVGILFNSRYTLARIGVMKPYLNLGAGIYKWKGIRGEIAADSTVTPAVPHIDKKELSETNWAFRTGLGCEFAVTQKISFDLTLFYRFIVGDLYPMMQPNLELDAVSGFQTLNISGAVRYYF